MKRVLVDGILADPLRDPLREGFGAIIRLA
jgi:hypothetical protein